LNIRRGGGNDHDLLAGLTELGELDGGTIVNRSSIDLQQRHLLLHETTTATTTRSTTVGAAGRTTVLTVLALLTVLTVLALLTLLAVLTVLALQSLTVLTVLALLAVLLVLQALALGALVLQALGLVLLSTIRGNQSGGSLAGLESGLGLGSSLDSLNGVGSTFLVLLLLSALGVVDVELTFLTLDTEGTSERDVGTLGTGELGSRAVTPESVDVVYTLAAVLAGGNGLRGAVINVSLAGLALEASLALAAVLGTGLADALGTVLARVGSTGVLDLAGAATEASSAFALEAVLGGGALATVLARAGGADIGLAAALADEAGLALALEGTVASGDALALVLAGLGIAGVLDLALLAGETLLALALVAGSGLGGLADTVLTARLSTATIVTHTAANLALEGVRGGHLAPRGELTLRDVVETADALFLTVVTDRHPGVGVVTGRSPVVTGSGSTDGLFAFTLRAVCTQRAQVSAFLLAGLASRLPGDGVAQLEGLGPDHLVTVITASHRVVVRLVAPVGLAVLTTIDFVVELAKTVVVGGTNRHPTVLTVAGGQPVITQRTTADRAAIGADFTAHTEVLATGLAELLGRLISDTAEHVGGGDLSLVDRGVGGLLQVRAEDSHGDIVLTVAAPLVVFASTSKADGLVLVGLDSLLTDDVAEGEGRDGGGVVSAHVLLNEAALAVGVVAHVAGTTELGNSGLSIGVTTPGGILTGTLQATLLVGGSTKTSLTPLITENTSVRTVTGALSLVNPATISRERLVALSVAELGGGGHGLGIAAIHVILLGTSQAAGFISTSANVGLSPTVTEGADELAGETHAMGLGDPAATAFSRVVRGSRPSEFLLGLVNFHFCNMCSLGFCLHRSLGKARELRSFFMLLHCSYTSFDDVGTFAGIKLLRLSNSQSEHRE